MGVRLRIQQGLSQGRFGELERLFQVIDLLSALSEPGKLCWVFRGQIPRGAWRPLPVVLKLDLAVGEQRGGQSSWPWVCCGVPGGVSLPVLVGAGHVAGQTVRAP